MVLLQLARTCGRKEHFFDLLTNKIKSTYIYILLFPVACRRPSPKWYPWYSTPTGGSGSSGSSNGSISMGKSSN